MYQPVVRGTIAHRPGHTCSQGYLLYCTLSDRLTMREAQAAGPCTAYVYQKGGGNKNLRLSYFIRERCGGVGVLTPE